MELFYLLPYPTGIVTSDDVSSDGDYADNANSYLEEAESDIRIAVVKLERAITFPIPSDELEEYNGMSDSDKRVRYKEYVDTIMGG